MIALAALTLTLTAWPQLDNAAFPQVVHHKLVVRGAADEAASVRGKIGKGWIVAFCTPRFCAPNHVDVTLPHGGPLTLDVQAIRTDDGASPSTMMSVETANARVSAAVRLRRPTTPKATR